MIISERFLNIMVTKKQTVFILLTQGFSGLRITVRGREFPLGSEVMELVRIMALQMEVKKNITFRGEVVLGFDAIKSQPRVFFIKKLQNYIFDFPYESKIFGWSGEVVGQFCFRNGSLLIYMGLKNRKHFSQIIQLSLSE